MTVHMFIGDLWSGIELRALNPFATRSRSQRLACSRHGTIYLIYQVMLAIVIGEPEWCLTLKNHDIFTVLNVKANLKLQIDM